MSSPVQPHLTLSKSQRRHLRYRRQGTHTPPGLNTMVGQGLEALHEQLANLEGRLRRIEHLLVAAHMPDFEALDRFVAAAVDKKESQAEPEQEASPQKPLDVDEDLSGQCVWFRLDEDDEEHCGEVSDDGLQCVALEQVFEEGVSDLALTSCEVDFTSAAVDTIPLQDRLLGGFEPEAKGTNQFDEISHQVFEDEAQDADGGSKPPEGNSSEKAATGLESNPLGEIVGERALSDDFDDAIDEHMYLLRCDRLKDLKQMAVLCEELVEHLDCWDRNPSTELKKRLFRIRQSIEESSVAGDFDLKEFPRTAGSASDLLVVVRTAITLQLQAVVGEQVLT
eukprot:TRINITY_DN18186_c0_g1_i1.p1 TRINITY_DN18186_c0_g1~~TRINITY_DN18186_c0_g1_i1.p1  ORF type:complete len:337 (-),score=78.55 TRINITY_DN18186_c0_g1_i1:512-1522(-)